MSRHVWTTPTHVDIDITDDVRDVYGTTLDDDNIAVVLSQDSDSLVIEGSYEELCDFAARLQEKIEEWLE